MIKFFRLSILMAMIAVAMTGCGDDEKENQPAIQPQSQEALTQTVFADQTDGKSGVTFVTTGPWTSTIKEGALKAGTEPDWVSIDPASGDKAGTYTITIKLEPNTTGEDRTANIIITCDGTDITIAVTQKGTTEDGTKYVPVTGITLSQTANTLFMGGHPLTLTANVLPVDANDKTVEWESSNPNVATVSGGVVTAVAEGTATITATTKDGGKTAKCAVTVKPAIVPITMTVAFKNNNLIIRLAGSGPVNINWGDGTASETYTLLTCDNNYDNVFASKFVYTHDFSSTNVVRTITITGENITHLNCDTNNSSLQNALTSLDVSGATSLIMLTCLNNQLTNLDVSKNTALISLSCAYGQITSLDVSKNTVLESLMCSGNELTNLDVSKNAALKYLWCDNTWKNKLTNLDVSKNTALITLDCTGNNLTNLSVSNNTALQELSCEYNQFSKEALNALFGTLHSNGGGHIRIDYNPGTSGCNRSIATEKGWWVSPAL